MAAYIPSVGDLVNVQPRTWPGINKLGGVGRITKLHQQGDSSSGRVQYDPQYGEVLTVDVKYVLGGTEKQVDMTFIERAGMELDRSARRSSGNQRPASARSGRASRGSHRPVRRPHQRGPVERTVPSTPSPASSVAAHVSSSEEEEDDADDDVDNDKVDNTTKKRSRSATGERRDVGCGTDRHETSSVSSNVEEESQSSSKRAKDASTETRDEPSPNSGDSQTNVNAAKDATNETTNVPSGIELCSSSLPRDISGDSSTKAKHANPEVIDPNSSVATDDNGDSQQACKKAKGEITEKEDEPSGAETHGASSVSGDVTAHSPINSTRANDESADTTNMQRTLLPETIGQATVSTQDSSASTENTTEQPSNGASLASEDTQRDSANTRQERTEHQSSVSLAAMDDSEDEVPKKDDVGGRMEMEKDSDRSKSKASTPKKRSLLRETYDNAMDEATKFVEAVQKAPVASIASVDEKFNDCRYTRFVSLLNSIMWRDVDGVIHVNDLVTKLNEREAKGEENEVVQPSTVGIKVKTYTEAEIRPYLNRLDKEHRIMLTENATMIYII